MRARAEVRVRVTVQAGIRVGVRVRLRVTFSTLWRKLALERGARVTPASWRLVRVGVGVGVG